jgi:hypothetical protein
MLLYNTEWWHAHLMTVNYSGKKCYNIGPWGQGYYLCHQTKNVNKAEGLTYKLC